MKEFKFTRIRSVGDYTIYEDVNRAVGLVKMFKTQIPVQEPKTLETHVKSIRESEAWKEKNLY